MNRAEQQQSMINVKNTQRSSVQFTHDGKVIKQYRGIDAVERFNREVMMLRHLEAEGCDFVPRLLEADSSVLQIITTNCGMSVEYLDAGRLKEIFDELEKYGVRHEDQARRNIIYRHLDGRFCVIDFEFAERISPSGSFSMLLS